MSILTLTGVSKSFGGQKVLDGLTMAVSEHSVYGFLGKNGAGKTTTMKLIAGFLRPDDGTITVCGKPVRFGSSPKSLSVGYLPDVPEFYPYMTPKEYLCLCGQLSSLTRPEIEAQTAELLALVGLDGVNRRIRGFSRGMKQRLGIAQALLGKPRLLLCDEPTSALDPSGRREVLEILKSISKDTTVLFSTHILSDVERICDQIGILDGGRLVLEGALEEVRGSYRTDRLLVVPQETASLAALAQGLGVLPEVQKAEVTDGGVILTIGNPETAGREILRYLSACDIPIAKYELIEPNLEQVFLEAIHP